LAAIDKPKLRNAYKKIKACAEPLVGVGDPAEISQEILDVLAALSGLKPVCVLGRGLDDKGWIANVSDIAATIGLHVAGGPLWDAMPWAATFRGTKLPDWYVDHCRDELAQHRAVYIWRTQAAGSAAQIVNASGGKLSIADEARLLGFPECCVAAFYQRALRYHGATISMLGRYGRNDEKQMRALMEGEGNMSPSTEQEIADLQAAFAIQPAPFGSWNMCDSCIASDAGPSANLSMRYRELAAAVDQEIVAALSS
jgi:hypothetical protein